MSVAVVTGASHGLGRCTAYALGRAGYDLALCARETIDFPTTGHGISGNEVFCSKVDVRVYPQVHEFMNSVLAKFGQVDVLVNNAGVVHPRKLVQAIHHEDFDAAFETHFCGPLGFIEKVLPGMLERKSGVIVNIVSKAARYAVPGFAAYNASKAALLSLTQTLAKEVDGTGVRVLSLSPGGMRTQMRVQAYGLGDAGEQQTPEFVASVILDLVTGKREVPNGVDVLVWKNRVELFPMEDRF